jgi:general stress protein 26
LEHILTDHAAEGLWFTFLANNATFKFDEIESDSSVNLSFLEPSSTSWVSVCGKAKCVLDHAICRRFADPYMPRITTDRELIKKVWSPFVSAWFGDLGDGVHKGDENDPRVSAIQVVPDEIRYWYAQRSTIGQVAEIATSAITGGTAVPGELRTITKAEIQLVEGLNTA